MCALNIFCAVYILYIFCQFVKYREKDDIRKVRYICILKLKQNLKKICGLLLLFYIENDQILNIDILQLINSANLKDHPIL